MQKQEDRTFEIGLALSGAISAGAYTAGVIDFLFQALSEWQKEQKEQEEREREQKDRASAPAHVPDHIARVTVMAGASAGAITGALGAVALARGIRPQDYTQDEVSNSFREPCHCYQTIRCILPTLYDTWVTRPRMVASRGGKDFLSEEDLRSGRAEQNSVSSLLNSTLLDEIKRKALLAGGASAPGPAPPYRFIANPLHIYMMVSNLRGIPFRVGFGTDSYGMQTHGDRVHYALLGLGGCAPRVNGWVDPDTRLDLSIATLPAANTQTVPREWDDYGTWALASSAFPAGFAARQIETPMAQYHNRRYPMPIAEGVSINPDFPNVPSVGDAEPQFIFRNVDGGLINNNPFDYAQYALMGGEKAEKTGGSAADSAVIMIAPFPEPPAFLPEDRPEPGLVSIIRALFPTLINQARFRASELAVALDPTDYSRFLVAPQRKLPGPGSEVEERYTIACGLLGGFGGFLDEGFRAHDFQLGRRNCQAFLQRIFALPAGNSVTQALVGKEAFTIPSNERDCLPLRYPIIPLLGSAVAEVPLRLWPQMKNEDFEELLRRIKCRYRALAPRLVRAQTTSRKLRLIGRVALFFGRKRVLKYVRLAILSDLIRRNQIKGWEWPSAINDWLAQKVDTHPDYTADNVRSVLAELASPAFDLRTEAGIATKAHLARPFVSDTLRELSRFRPNEPCAVWCDRDARGEALFTLASRKPGWSASLPLVRQVKNWLGPAVTDQDSVPRQLGS